MLTTNYEWQQNPTQNIAKMTDLYKCFTWSC